MKVIGWILVVFGGLALIGSIAGGHSPFGPSFWMALGFILVYFGNKKEKGRQSVVKEKEETNNTEIASASKINVNEKHKATEIKPSSNDGEVIEVSSLEMKENKSINQAPKESKKLYSDGFAYKSQDELEKMAPVDLFRYRCKQAIIQTMAPLTQTNNTGCQSEACKKLMSLANQMSNSTVLMETALLFGYGGSFSDIIYGEIDLALQSYCDVSIYDVWDFNETNKVFDVDNSLELYINSNRLMQALKFNQCR